MSQIKLIIVLLSVRIWNFSHEHTEDEDKIEDIIEDKIENNIE